MRSDMRWLLLLTAIIGIVGSANALKATSLIFGRAPNANRTAAAATTTTTSTTVASVDADSLIDEEKKDDGETADEESATKPPLTGIPQIDYIWDPNLPRELNGYNLSTYPFLNSVPDNDDIDFKCDGLHDGFYASIKYSCQLYHHCVYGIRHDFLCANFTAFDQKSFICHFVSEVNCKASPKYWFRNDALYKATTTTSTTTTTIAPPPTTSQAPERPLRRPESRRPLRRRRPQHEYFYDDEDYDDDYVEERMNRRRKTNRNRNRRPEYDDEYDNPPSRTNYKEDDDYSEFDRPAYRHRNRNRDNSDDNFEYDRRSYRNRKRPMENKRHYDDDGVEIEDRPHSDGRKSVENGKRKKNDRRTSVNDDKSSIDDRRPQGEDQRYDRRKLNDDRRPMDEDRRSSIDEGRRPNHEKRRPNTDARRPQYDDDEYDDYVIDKSKKHNNHDDDYDDRFYSKRPKSSQPEIIPKVRSSSATASIYNRPRAPPKINRPVPNNEKKKYEYTPQKLEKVTTATPALATEDEIYDEYDYEVQQQPDIKHEQVDNKKVYPVSSSQRDQRLPTSRDKIPPSSFNTDELRDDDDFDNKEKVTSIKPQRSTSPKVEPIQQQPHRPTKTEFYEKPKEASIKPNERPPLDFNKDEYIPDTEPEYSDEDVEDRITKEDEEVRPPETIPMQNDFRTNLSVHEHQINMPDPITIPKLVKDHEEVIPKIPFPSTPLQTSSQQDSLQYKTKFHRLGPIPNVRTGDDAYHKSVNTEPEERDVYTILPKVTISTIQEPSGFFKPMKYNEPPHDTELDSPKNRPYVRIMKRPFLPSRGGSPYLPRGLKPVGAGITSAEFTTEGFHGSSKLSLTNIAHTQLFGQNVPNSRANLNNAYVQPQSLHQLPTPSPHQPHSITNIGTNLQTTTEQPQIESPRSPLDEIFNSDYDSLNDALNPTLKPLSHSHESPIGFSLNKYDRGNPYARSDVSHSSSQYRTTAIPIPIHSRQIPQMAAQQQQPPPPQQLQQQQQQQQYLQQQPQQQPHQQPQQQRQQQQQPQQQQQRQPQQSQQQSQYYDDEYDY